MSRGFFENLLSLVEVGEEAVVEASSLVLAVFEGVVSLAQQDGLDEWTAALNTGDMDLVNSFYADDAQLWWIVDGAEVPVDRDEYFNIPAALAQDYEFVSAGHPNIESGMAVFVVQVLKLTPPDGNTLKLMVIGRHMSATTIVQEWLLWESPPL